MCCKYHALKVCPKFLQMTPEKRNQMVLREAYCINCLARSHRFRDCQSRNMCRKCNRPHHTLLHQKYPELNIKRQQPINNNNTNSNKRCKIRHNKINKRSNNGNKNDKDTMSKQASKEASQQIISEAIKALASVLCSTHP